MMESGSTFFLFSLNGDALTVESNDPSIIHIPSGMTPWQGQGIVPPDWDQGKVLTRCGLMVQPHVSVVDADWTWSGDPNCPPPFSIGPNGKEPREPNPEFQRLFDCIAYTKRQIGNQNVLV